MAIVIGLHGAKGSGKDYFYKVVKKAFPLHDIRKVAYADPIKNELMRIFDLATEDQYDLFKRTDVSYTLLKHLSHQVPGRQVVREIGMLMRKYDENQFTRYVEDEIAKAPGAIWCITDLRFNNELDSINKLGGVVVKIQRPHFKYDGHVTETEFPDEKCSTIIDNTGTLSSYERKVMDTFKQIIQGEL